MEVLSGDRIREGMDYLEWSIEKEKETGLTNGKENVWSRYRIIEEEYFAKKLNEIVRNKSTHPEQVLVDKIFNLLNNFQRNPLIYSKNSQEQGKYMVVVGGGKMFTGHLGDGNLKTTVRTAISMWIKKLIQTSEEKGASIVSKEWSDEEETGIGYAARDMFNREREKTKESTKDPVFIIAEDSVIPPEVKACFADADLKDETYMLLRRRAGTKAHWGKGKKSHKTDTNRVKLFAILSKLKYTGLLENSQVAAQIMVFKQKEDWQQNQEKVMGKIWESVELWPFVSVDSEGAGAWFQIGYFGSAGWECLLFCAFLPVEIMELLESTSTILTGVDIHSELGLVLDTLVWNFICFLLQVDSWQRGWLAGAGPWSVDKRFVFSWAR